MQDRFQHAPLVIKGISYQGIRSERSVTKPDESSERVLKTDKMTFKDFNLKAEIIEAIDELGFTNPTPVQEKVIPFMLDEERDLVALAQTGTGKTAAFGLPIVQTINENQAIVQALVLSPTRELCIQIANDLKDFSKKIKAKVVPVYGGEDIRSQLRQLDNPPQILVATPGRLLDLVRRGKVQLQNIQYLVLDEADEMLNMGFKEDIETILKETPETRRTTLFSATMPADIARIAKQYMKDYQEIVIGSKNAGSDNVSHIYYVCQAKQRYLVLKRIVDFNPDIYGIVFCRTRQETKDVADWLMKDGYNADALHGDLSQAQRDHVMHKFRQKNIQLLVATDVAARGLDVSDLTHVINYNLPEEEEVYTHRSGRTGRVNKKGVSIAIIHSREQHKIKNLEKRLKKDFEKQLIPNGLEVCKKQLFHMIDKMQHVDINEELIQPYIDQISKQLDYLDKNELLKRFVSLEFNRFLDYYKDTEDLNYYAKEKEENRDDSRASRKFNKGQRGMKLRLRLNAGNNQGIFPAKLLGIINDIVGDKSISIGDIEVTDKFTYFDVFLDQADKITQAFAGQKRYGLSVSKEKNAANTTPSATKNSRKKNKRKSNRANDDKPWRKRK